MHSNHALVICFQFPLWTFFLVYEPNHNNSLSTSLMCREFLAENRHWQFIGSSSIFIELRFSFSKPQQFFLGPLQRSNPHFLSLTNDVQWPMWCDFPSQHLKPFERRLHWMRPKHWISNNRTKTVGLFTFRKMYDFKYTLWLHQEPKQLVVLTML